MAFNPVLCKFKHCLCQKSNNYQGVCCFSPCMGHLIPVGIVPLVTEQFLSSERLYIK